MATDVTILKGGLEFPKCNEAARYDEEKDVHPAPKLIPNDDPRVFKDMKKAHDDKSKEDHSLEEKF